MRHIRNVLLTLENCGTFCSNYGEREREREYFSWMALVIWIVYNTQQKMLFLPFYLKEHKK